MSPRTLVYLGMFIGGVVGGYIPVLLGSSLLSFTSIIGNAIGAILGIIICYKLSQ